MRVLIVEDDVAARRGLTELVRAWGYEAEAAPDGEEALALITSFRPSAILADLVMPRLDGLDLLRRVKDQLSDLTFILITAQGSVDTAVMATTLSKQLRGVADEFLLKVNRDRPEHLEAILAPSIVPAE